MSFTQPDIINIIRSSMVKREASLVKKGMEQRRAHDRVKRELEEALRYSMKLAVLDEDKMSETRLDDDDD